jgi:hypothetical protein
MCRHLHVNFFFFKAQKPGKIVVHDDLPAFSGLTRAGGFAIKGDGFILK